jgi:hypothetical protein
MYGQLTIVSLAGQIEPVREAVEIRMARKRAEFLVQREQWFDEGMRKRAVCHDSIDLSRASRDISCPA